MWSAIVTLGFAGLAVMAVLVVAAVSFTPIGPGSEVDPAPGKDACALLTHAEIQSATGWRIAVPNSGGFPSECLWTFPCATFDPTGPNPTFLGVDISYSTVQNYSDTRNGLRPSGETSEIAIPGLGDEAFVQVARLQRNLWVRRGKTVLVIEVSLSTTDPYNLGIEKQLALRALTRA